MDCRTARLLLDFARPLCPELDSADAEALHTHLADCPECGPVAAAERRSDDHLGRAMRDVPVPADFRQRLLNRLTKERDAWWRRWVLRGGAAAAAVLLVCVGAMWYFGRPPDLDLREIQRQAQAEEKLPADSVKVAEWFRRKGVNNVKVPEDFNYNFLADYNLVRFRGRTVPMLHFMQSNKSVPASNVYVYVLTDDQFNLASLQTQPSKEESGSPRLQVVESGDEHVVFIAVYNNDLESFKKVVPGT